MTYLLQIQTRDLGIQLKTECLAETLEALQAQASNMVKSNPIVKGMSYRIFSIVKVSGKFESTMVKEAVIAK